MKHEPDIIREAEGVLQGVGVRVEDAAAAVRQAYAALPSMHDIANTPLHGLDNPEPTVRVAADEQRDYGDEDRNAR